MAAGEPGPSSLGARLKSAREHAGLTVIQAAERLHVDPQLIEALEGERFEEVGASVYVRGHIRHYAELVGESAGELHELYSASAHAARTPDLTRVPKGGAPASTSSALLVPAVLVVAIVAVIGMVWWVGGTLNTLHRVHRAAATATVPAAAASAPNGGGAPGAADSAGSAGSAVGPAGSAVGPAAGPSPPAGPDAADTAASAGGGAQAGAGAGAQSAPAGSASAGSAPAGSAPAGASGVTGVTSSKPPSSPAAVPARTAALRMHFAEDSWTEVYDARGERLFYDIGPADSTRTVSGVPPLRVVLGNPVVVSLELDGRPVPIPDGARRNVLLKFRITSSGRAAPAHLAAAGTQRAPAAGVQAH